MGKTITSQYTSPNGLNQNTSKILPDQSPIYFDLRLLTLSNKRVPTLEQTFEECIARGWQYSGSSQELVLKNILDWIDQGAVVIFDGPDEVLIKLSKADGLIFTNTLLKLIADTQHRAQTQQRPARIKMLHTCRTQYFPTLKAQKAYFNQAERGEFSADHYRAMPLMPWNETQVRRYLTQALPHSDIDTSLATVRAVHNPG